MIKLLVMLFFPRVQTALSRFGTRPLLPGAIFSGAVNSGSHFFLVPFLPVPFSPVSFFSGAIFSGPPHRIVKPGQHVLAVTSERQVAGRVAT